ncbi:MAG: acyltransferase [Anaerolineales bacterium]|nr:acyltransferase [Anaerolineales bacterium]
MKRLEQLQFLRFFASLWIVIYHFGVGTVPFDREPFIRVVRGDSFIVSFFFVLSGFIIAYVYYPQALKGINFKDFLVKRLSRFLPLYWVTLAIMMVLFWQKSSRPVFVSALEIPLLHAWVPNALFGFNFPDWAMSVFLAIYAIFPLLFSWIVRQGDKKAGQLIIGFWVASQLVIHILDAIFSGGGISWWGDFIRFNPLFHLNTFLLGVLGGYYYRLHWVEKPANQSVNSIQIVLAAILFTGFALYRYELQQATPFRLAFATGLLAPYYLWVLILLARDTGRLSNFLSSRVLVMLGDLSFSIYLLQSPVYELYEKHLLPRFEFHFPWSEPFHFYIYLILLFAAAFFSRHLFEIPIQRFIRQRLVASG